MFENFNQCSDQHLMETFGSINVVNYESIIDELSLSNLHTRLLKILVRDMNSSNVVKYSKLECNRVQEELNINGDSYRASISQLNELQVIRRIRRGEYLVLI